jgi:hypothetical protein
LVVDDNCAIVEGFLKHIYPRFICRFNGHDRRRS